MQIKTEMNYVDRFWTTALDLTSGIQKLQW
jgi:hypothetical protein